MITIGENVLTTMTLIALAGVLAPLIAARVGIIPAVVLEIAFGVLIGPQVLGWAHEDGIVDTLSQIGLAMLIFLAGYEIDLPDVRGKPLRLAVTGWLISLALGLALAFAIRGWTTAALVVGLCLTTTALGTILPIVRDAGLVKSPLGTRVLAVGALGEFGPIVAMSLLLTTNRPVRTALLLVGFAVLAFGAAVLARRPHSKRWAHLLRVTLGTSAQLAVRLALLVVMALVWVAASFGLDTLLGAFAAGLVIRLAHNTMDSDVAAVVSSKLEAVGFGFLVPIFFVVSGMGMDLASMSIPLVLAFLVVFFVVRGIPVLFLHRNDLPSVQRRSLALFASAGLPLIVVISGIGVEVGAIDTATAASLVAAGALSVLVYPAAGLHTIRHERSTVHSGRSDSEDRP